jgi:FkbM family methyltransferase
MLSLSSPVQGALSTLLGARRLRDRLWMAWYLLSRRIRWLPAPSERTLHLRGLPTPFVFDPALGGLSAYYEIARAKIYGRFPGFTPEPTACVVDVGANLGMFSVWASRYLAPTGRVIALEPHPDAYRLLRRNLSSVPCAAEALNVACGATEQTLPLYFSPERLTVATLELPAGQLLERIEVPVRRLDDVLTELGVQRIGLLKIDVEGWELQVLDGAEDCLRRTDRLVLEVDRRQLPSVEERLAAAELPVRGVIDGVWNGQEMVVLYAERGFSASPSGGPDRSGR